MPGGMPGGTYSASVSELHGRVDGVFMMPRCLDVVDAAARDSTRLVRESCGSSVTASVPHRYARHVRDVRRYGRHGRRARRGAGGRRPEDRVRRRRPLTFNLRPSRGGMLVFTFRFYTGRSTKTGAMGSLSNPRVPP